MASRGRATQPLRKSPRLANINCATCPSAPPPSLTPQPTPQPKRTVRSYSSHNESASSQHEWIPHAPEVSEPSLGGSHTDISATEMSSTSNKKRRGQTRGVELSKKGRRSTDLLEVDIPEHIKRAVGNNCQSYITNLGCILRRNAPLQVERWKKIERVDVELLIRRVRESFKLSDEAHVNLAIEDHLKRRYTTWRYNLHKIYLRCGSVEEALENRPNSVAEDDWNYLVTLWQKDEWLTCSAKNKANREKLKITHCAGTKAFSRIRYENASPETGKEPSRIELFELTRFSTKKTAWVGENAKHAFDEMKKLKNLPEADDDDEVYDKVLSDVVGPPRPGYIRGLGAGPKPKRSKYATYSNANVVEATRRAEEANRRADEAEKRCEDLEDQLHAMQMETAEQKYALAGLKSRQNETDQLLNRLLARLSSTSSSTA